MRVTKKTVSTVFTGAMTAAAVTGLTQGQAHAASLWHVKNGGVGYHGVFKAAGTGSFADTTKGLTLSRCSAATASGSIPASTFPGPKIGTVALGIKNCTLLGLTLTVHATASMLASTYASGRVHGRLGMLKGTISGVNSACRASFSGSESLTFSTGHLAVDGRKIAGIHIAKATNCPFGVGDKGYLAGAFTVTVPSALTISRP